MSAADTTVTPTAVSGRDDPALAAPVPPAVFADRLERLAAQLVRAGIDVAVIGSGADLQYCVGHTVSSHERLTCLVLAADGTATMLVPTLERPGWAGTSVDELDLDIHTWNDGQDPYVVLAGLLPESARMIAVDYYLPAMHALGIRDAVPGSELALAGEAIAELRMRKDAAEVTALAAAGAAIDRVHGRIGEWLHAGRTERAVAVDIAAALLEEGHAEAAFVIVGSGANGASPHHGASDRVIQEGDAVVIDIGGPTAAGYNSDCTRTYCVGEPSDPDYASVYDLVLQAQQAGVAAATAGRTCESVDAASRRVIEQAGYGEYFITRTGHGIGLEVHEHPYLVSGNTRTLEPGMAVSVEPGIYLPGRFGVRIEDIVVVGRDGAPQLMNLARTDRIVLPATAAPSGGAA